jgi:hypothetical protein
MRRVWSTVAGMLVLVAGVAPARAGGALLDFDREFYVPGDVVHASSGVWLKSSNGRLDDGPYFAYLSRYAGLDGMPPPLPPDALRVTSAEVAPRSGDDAYGDVSVEFVLPELEPGRYWVTLCDEPCELLLGDVMPTLTTVAADEAEGRLATAMGRLADRLRTLRITIGNRVFGHRGDSIRSRLTAVERDVARIEAEIEQLGAATPEPEPAPEERSSALPPLLAFVVPAALAGVLLGRRSRSRARRVSY